MGPLILYTRPDCHLCDDMKDLLAAVAPRATYDLVNIESDLGLVSRYGIRIPVLKRTDSGAELGWPADADSLNRFLST